jgi:hypothetical protein
MPYFATENRLIIVVLISHGERERILFEKKLQQKFNVKYHIFIPDVKRCDYYPEPVSAF